MLPKPNFGSNHSNTSGVNTTADGGHQSRAWFQYNPNQSLVQSQQFPQMRPQFQHNYHQNSSYGNYHHLNQSFNTQNFNNGYYNQSYGQNNNHNSGPNGHQNKRFKSNVNNDNNNKKTSLNCDTCCRWFTSQELYDQHIAEHIMCGLDECTFRAHPKVIESHQRMQHFCFKDKTLVKRFMSLESEEDIKKWREERRRHFPTKDNIEKKADMREKERLEAIEKRNQLMEMKEKERQMRDNERQLNGKETQNDVKTGETKSELIDEKNKRFDRNSKNNRNNRNKKQMKGNNRWKPVDNNNNNNRKLTLFQKLMLHDIQNNEDIDEKKSESIEP
ncbi:unnamed protein product [Medioppia subpectinata]|uniref:C2H2-type domain-containing protein n=1 Tax=Medioppia subpectinata TaxID=1979941 RepID=A0A7R9KX67_9ACAR|nr:unnamed protein product [Medioppia subpectinata]CAG2111163.1 unnamed protein product [Medioppia subpectinata]